MRCYWDRPGARNSGTLQSGHAEDEEARMTIVADTLDMVITITVTSRVTLLGY